MNALGKKLAIIGGGASGLCAAIEARFENPNIDITIFEKMSKPCKKILATGNGRCNFSNKDLSPVHFYGEKSFLRDLLTSPFADSEGFFRSLGVLAYEEDERLYPRSQQASTIKDALVNKAISDGVIIKTDCTVFEIKKNKNSFFINGEAFDAVIICGGGKASSVHGSDGSCYKLLTAFGHSSTPLYPALCGLTVSDKDLNLLKGVRAECQARLYSENSLLGSEEGEIQFNDKAISGIPIMNLSHLCENKKNLYVSLDLCPEIDEKELTEHIKASVNNSKDIEFEVVLNGIVNLKLGYALMNRCFIKPKTICENISNQQIKNVVSMLKAFEINISSAKGFDSAQVTKGGIKTDEISSKTMMSKIVDGVFACGEILDIHGDCGGYNLHLAWTTGRIAGSSAGSFLK